MTIDIIHDAGFLEGRIGFQICHLHTTTVMDVKVLFIREQKTKQVFPVSNDCAVSSPQKR